MTANGSSDALDPGPRDPQCRAQRRVGDVGEGLPDADGVQRAPTGAMPLGIAPRRSADAIRNSSRRRNARTACTAASRVTMAVHRRRERLHKGLTGTRYQLAVVGEEPQCLGVAAEQVADVAGQAQQAGQAQRNRSLVAQQPQEPRRRPQPVRHLPVGQQPAVGLGRIGELVQQHGQERVLDGGVPRHPAGERLQVAQSGGRILEAEDLEALARRGRSEAQRLTGHPSHRFQEGSVDQLGVQPPYLLVVRHPRGPELVDRVALLVGAEPHGLGQPAQRPRPVRGAPVRHGVGAPQALQLEAVLDRAQEPVRLDERVAVLATDVAALRQRAECVQRRW